jgi:hypothetical protein
LPCSVTDELKAFVKSDPPAEDGRVFYGKDGRDACAQRRKPLRQVSREVGGYRHPRSRASAHGRFAHDPARAKPA